MRIRLRGPSGQSILNISENASILELQSQIFEKTSLKDPEIKYGYPPLPLRLEDYSKSSKLSDIGIRLDGEQLIVSRKFAVPTAQEFSQRHNHQENIASSIPGESRTLVQPNQQSTFSFDGFGEAPPKSADATSRSNLDNPPLSLGRKDQNHDPPELPLPTHSSVLLLRIMPDDNSCLFRAFNSAYFGAMDNVTELRSVIAQNIQSDPEIYPAVVLEKDPDDYCRWIQTENAWGGAIELDILSKHFEIEICSIDVQTLRVDRYNEGKPSMCILVYSGIHYDVIATSPSDPPYTNAYAPPEFDVKVYSSGDQVVLEKAVELCRVLQGQHYFTDTSAFSVLCNVCGKVCTGEQGATEHAKETGHYDFGESG